MLRLPRMIGPILVVLGMAGASREEEPWRLRMETREPGGRRVTTPVAIDPAKTAILVVGVEDAHWCKTFDARVANLIPRLNRTLAAARGAGIPVIFVRSVILDQDRNSPQYLAMRAAKPVVPPVGRAPEIAPLSWSRTGGCECGPDLSCARRHVESRPNRNLGIAPADLIADGDDVGTLYGFCRARKIDTLIYSGVALNMAVADCGVGIRAMRSAGLRTLFFDDLVVAISGNGYDPDKQLRDDSFTPALGTATVARELELAGVGSLETRRWLEVATGGPADARPHAVCVLADDEYETERTVPEFFRERMSGWRVTVLTPDPGDRNVVPGLDAVADADVVVLSMRRRFLSAASMDHLERYLRAGKPLVAIRLGISPFAVGSGLKPVAPGQVVWQRFDRDALGCDYQMYDPAARKTGSDVAVLPSAREHPILAGLDAAGWHTTSWIYRVNPLAVSATPFLEGRWAASKEVHPVAWVNRPEGARIFYTCLGHPDDFKLEVFRLLLANALKWTVNVSP